MQNSLEIHAAIHSKVKNELMNFVYSNLFTTIPLLAVTAGMLVFKLNGHISKPLLICWLSAFLVVALGQGILVTWFNKTKDSQKWDHLYFKLLIADVGLIGLLWGIAGVFFMPEDTLGQSYLIFILAFVAAGGLLYLARCYLAGIVYATGVLIPLVGSLIFSFFSQSHHEIYFNITLGLACYWSFLLVVSYYGSKLFAENYTQSLVNKALSEDLSQTNEELGRLTLSMRTEEEKLLLSPIQINIPKTLDHLIYTDALTGADSPEILEIKFAQSRAYARRHHQHLAVFLININNHSDVDSKLGTDIGNLLLKTTAIRLLYCKRETDILSRIATDQFVLIVSEVLLGNEIMSVVNKILKIFAEKTIINESQVSIDASIGISVYPKDGENLPELIGNSSRALSYLAAQNDPGTHFQLYDPEKMHSEIHNKSTLIDHS